MQKLIFLITLFPFFLIEAKAQKKEKTYPWGIIDPIYLKMTEYALDTSAEALVLCDIGEWSVSDDYSYILKTHRQVKIFKKSAFADYATVILPYRPSGSEYIWNFDALVTHSDGTQEKMDKSKIIDERVDKEYTIMKFTFSGLREGDVIEYGYSKKSNYISFIGPWYFQEDAPVIHSEISFASSVRLEYQFVYSGYLTPKREIFSGIKLSLDSVPALKANEAHITTPKDYCASVSFQLSRYVNENGNVKKMIDSWEQAAKAIEEDFNFGQLYKKKRFYAAAWKQVEPLLEKATNDMDKIETIYSFVNSKVNWDENFSFWSEKDLEDVLKKGKGSSGEINLLMLALLREADIKAVPMLISTRDHGKVFEGYPLIQKFNHVLCYIEIGEKKMVLDGGNRYRPAGMPKGISLSGRGWIVDGANTRWADIPANPLYHTISLSSFNLDEEGTINGTITLSFQQYAAIASREGNKNDVFNDKLKKRLTSLFPDIIIDSIKTFNVEDLKMPVKKIIHCKIPNFATISGDMIYLKPLVLTDFDENPFKTTDRNFPVDMNYISKEQTIINLSLPKNYEVLSLPKNAIMTLMETGGKAQYNISNENNEKIQVNFNVLIPKTNYLASEYIYLRDFYSNIVSKVEEQIVLKKKM